jgi:hypothetical protein
VKTKHKKQTKKLLKYCVGVFFPPFSFYFPRFEDEIRVVFKLYKTKTNLRGEAKMGMKGAFRDGQGRKRLIRLILASLVIIFSTQVIILADDIPELPYPTSMTLTADPAYIPINGGTAAINATVYYSDGKIHSVVCEFNNPTSLGNLSRTVAYSYPEPPIILTSGTTGGTEIVEAWPRSKPSLKKTVTVVFTGEDVAPPSITNPEANPEVILNDNGRGRAVGTDVSRINVTVTDDGGVAGVNIDLSPIGGSATQPMNLLEGTNINGIWTVTTTATVGVNNTHSFLVNATDFYGRFNNTESVPLEVLRRGDVVRDNTIDMKDMLYIARYTVGYEPEVLNPPSVFVGDVVGEAGDPTGDGKVDMKDAFYIARWAAGQEEEP